MDGPYDVTSQFPGAPLTNLQPTEYLWVSHISIPHYRVSFTETHLKGKVAPPGPFNHTQNITQGYVTVVLKSLL